MAAFTREDAVSMRSNSYCSPVLCPWSPGPFSSAWGPPPASGPSFLPKSKLPLDFLLPLLISVQNRGRLVGLVGVGVVRVLSFGDGDDDADASARGCF